MACRTRLRGVLCLLAGVLVVAGCGIETPTRAAAEPQALPVEADAEAPGAELPTADEGPDPATGAPAGDQADPETASASDAPVPPPGGERQQPPADVAPDEPAELSIPAIGVRSRLVRLGLNDDRTLEVPSNFALAGWYTKAPKPGEVGPAIVAGHVDSVRGPAVFSRLHEMEAGQPVHVRRGDGQVVTFVVDRVERHPKDAFPTEQVYGDTEGPELRLITCGGDFDRTRRSYRDNIIVYASLVADG